MLRLETVYVFHTVDPVQSRWVQLFKKNPLIKSFEASLLPLFILYFFKDCRQFVSASYQTSDAHSGPPSLHFPSFFYSLQKQLHSPLHNSIIFTFQKHVPEASLVSSSSSRDNHSAGDIHSHLSQPRIRKTVFLHK